MTDRGVTDPGVQEQPPGTPRDHPPLRMRERRHILIPDLRPPSLDEIRWAARQRRVRRQSLVPHPRFQDLHGPSEQREQEAVAAAVEETLVVELPAELPALDAVVVEPADTIVLPDIGIDAADEAASSEAPPIEELEPYPADEDLPPLVTHALVVHEPAPLDPGRIAVLDEVDLEAPPTVTRIVPLPAEAIEEFDVGAADTDSAEPLEALEVESEDDLRGAPLYWRLLRLRYTRPNGWLRALYFEGAVTLAVVLVLAEAASVWTIVVLPFVVAVVVKANDVVAGNLRRAYRRG